MNKLKFRNVIIGSGPAGSVLSDKLSSIFEDTCLIEEGPNYINNESFFNSLSKYWRNSGVTPIIGDKNFVLGEAKCLGGGSSLNAGLIWRTPEHILDTWKKKYDSSFFKNFDTYFKDIEKKLNITNSIDDNPHTSRFLTGSDKLSWSTIKVRKNIDKIIGDNAFGDSNISMVNNYIKSFKKKGTLFANFQLLKIIIKNYNVEKIIVLDLTNNKKIEIYGDYFFISCGSIQTPHILKKNKIINDKISSMFHLNIRVLSKFPDKIDLSNGSFASSEIDQYQKEGIIFIPSSLEKKFISSSLVDYDDFLIKDIIDNIEYCGFIVAQLKLSSRINIHSLPFLDQPILSNWLNINDKKLIKNSIIKLINLLVMSGSKEIYFPSKVVKIKNNTANYDINAIIKKINYLTVHTMSSIPIFVSQIINNNASHKDIKNLYVCDSSILPDSIGQSPQGTIMAFAYEVANQFLND